MIFAEVSERTQIILAIIGAVIVLANTASSAFGAWLAYRAKVGSELNADHLDQQDHKLDKIHEDVKKA